MSLNETQLQSDISSGIGGQGLYAFLDHEFYTVTFKTKYGSWFLKFAKLDQPGCYDLFCLSIDEIFLESEDKVK